MKWLFFMLVAFHVVTVFIAGMNKQHDDYLECTNETDFNPGVCDCTGRKCFIKLTVTKRKFDNKSRYDETQLFSVNGGRIGPTIIAKYNQLIVADVYNEINDPEDPANANLSMHWHGMRQFNTDWMDGVGMITQWPTKPHNAFRYVFRAYPGGTHWYHSHMLLQQDEGIVGALIVRDENTEPNRKLMKDVVDKPAEMMLAVRDKIHKKRKNGSRVEYVKLRKSRICEPDRSMFPFSVFFGNKDVLGRLRINGVKLANKLPISTKKLKPIFYVKRGKSFRFRILGIMAVDVLRISIDKHKLHVMSADGYLTKPFTTDLLVFHIAERYDFILKATENYEAGTIFPIRIETIAVNCSDYSTPEMVGYAYLQYTDSDIPEKPRLVDHYGDKHRCKVEKCTALNCPFQSYPPEANITCHNVAKLRLLNPTLQSQLPQHPHNVVERFLNFAYHPGPTINGVQNNLPLNVPFVHAGKRKVVNECQYGDRRCTKPCAHSLYVPKPKNKANGKFMPKTIRFVLSSLVPVKTIENITPDIVTHPVHLHGHSFFVTKIGYPLYSKTGAIIRMNPNLTQPNPESGCGPAHWTNGKPPSNIVVDSRTVRKDVVIVPAGGYVVIEFLAYNPGWWFLHCHIDRHLVAGMAIAISELPGCQTGPKNDEFKVAQPYWLSERRYLKHERFDDKCNITEYKKNNIGKSSDEPEDQAPEIEKKSDEITAQNLRQKKFGSAVTNDELPYWRWRVSPYHKRGLYHMLKAIERPGRKIMYPR